MRLHISKKRVCQEEKEMTISNLQEVIFNSATIIYASGGKTTDEALQKAVEIFNKVGEHIAKNKPSFIEEKQ